MKFDRKKKEYSEKLFNELVIFYLLNRTGYFFEYEASFLLKISSRTLRRYVREINQTCILHRNGKPLKTYVENGYKSYHVYLDEFNKEKDPFADALNPKPILLPIGFCQKHPKGLDSENKHIVRLTRCALLLHDTYNVFRNGLGSSWKTPEDIMKEIMEYYFEEMKFDVSLKTFKRDLKLVTDVIVFMNDK